eukprot:scaffold32639_cov112-Isochrysis_galbana.AAC.7
MHQADASCTCSVENTVAQPCGISADRTHTTSNVAVLKARTRLGYHVVSASEHCDAAADDFALHCGHDRNAQRAERREAREGALQRHGGNRDGHTGCALLRVRVTADREVRPSRLDHDGAYIVECTKPVHR